MKNYNMILTERLLKYRLYHLVKFINMNISQVKKLPSNQQQIIEQEKFIYSPLGKTFEKQIKAFEDQGQKQLKPLENLKNH